MASLSSLPTEVQLHIFGFLQPFEMAKLSCVCRRLQELSDESLKSIVPQSRLDDYQTATGRWIAAFVDLPKELRRAILLISRVLPMPDILNINPLTGHDHLITIAEVCEHALAGRLMLVKSELAEIDISDNERKVLLRLSQEVAVKCLMSDARDKAGKGRAIWVRKVKLAQKIAEEANLPSPGVQGLMQVYQVSKKGRYYDAIETASLYGCEKVIRVLADEGWSLYFPYGYYGNAMQAASYGGYSRLVQFFLDHGFDVNTPGGQYGHALQAAAYRGHEDVARLLIDNGAGVNIEGGFYGTALHAASLTGHEAVVRLLIDNGANVNFLLPRSGTALHFASSRGKANVVQVLIDSGADVNARGAEETPLMNASYCPTDCFDICMHKEVLKILIVNGADVNAQGGEYGSALRAALSSDNQSLAQILIENGAKNE